MEPLDASGGPAAVGERGRWLSGPDDVVATASLAAREVSRVSDAPLRLCFPRNWPGCFKESAALQKLLNKTLKGKRVRVVTPNPTVRKAAASVPLHPLHSFANAERIAAALNWPVVKGALVLEVEEEEAGTVFVALRHWWNELPNKSWADLTPRVGPGGDSAPSSLLIECDKGEKAEAELDAKGVAWAINLAKRLHAAAAPPPPPGPPAFVRAVRFEGRRRGYVFTTGAEGTGYYLDKAADEGEDTDDVAEGAPSGVDAADGAVTAGVASLAACRRCEGCGQPAAHLDAADESANDDAATCAKLQGSAALKAGDAVMAAALFAEAARRVPSCHTHFANLSLALLRVPAPRRAAAAARRCVALVPEFAKGYFRLGQALRDSGQRRAAAAAYVAGRRVANGAAEIDAEAVAEIDAELDRLRRGSDGDGEAVSATISALEAGSPLPPELVRFLGPAAGDGGPPMEPVATELERLAAYLAARDVQVTSRALKPTMALACRLSMCRSLASLVRPLTRLCPPRAPTFAGGQARGSRARWAAHVRRLRLHGVRRLPGRRATLYLPLPRFQLWRSVLGPPWTTRQDGHARRQAVHGAVQVRGASGDGAQADLKRRRFHPARALLLRRLWRRAAQARPHVHQVLLRRLLLEGPCPVAARVPSAACHSGCVPRTCHRHRAARAASTLS